MNYEKRISDLLEAVSTLLEANKAIGEDIAAKNAKFNALMNQLSIEKAKNESLELKLTKLAGELSQYKCSQFGKSREKSSDKSARDKSQNGKDE